MHRLFPYLLAFTLFPLGVASAAPNILILFADDLGYADIGANGVSSDILTPNIDAIAKAGVQFTDGYATHPVCSPSRAGLMSGMYQHRFGFEHNSGPEAYADPNFGLPRSIPTLAEKLSAAGYATGMVGKWHIGFRESLRPWERGFDFFHGFLSGARSYLPDGRYTGDPIWRNGEKLDDDFAYLTDAFTDEAVGFLKERGDEPWFLYLAFNAVHDPMEATEAYEARFPEITDPRRRTLAAMLAAMDDAIGKVMATVRERGEEEETLVFFYSDNGGIPPKNASLNDPLRGQKGQMFEGGIRVPFLTQWKGTFPEGEVYPHAVMGFDVHATALAAAGLPLDSEPQMDGVDLLPYIKGEAEGRPHEALFWRAAQQHAARVGDWKLVKTPRESAMLFNLATDLGEQQDLAASEPEKLQELQTIYAAWDRQMMEPSWIRQDRRNAEPGGTLKSAPTESGGAPQWLQRVFQNADANGDGKLSRQEFPRNEIFDEVDTDQDGFASRDEVRLYFRNPKYQSNASEPEAPLFRRVEIPGLTDVESGTNGFAIADLNQDGWLDYVATQSIPGIHLPKGPKGNPIRKEDLLRVLINREGKGFDEHEITIESDWLTSASFGRSSQIPNLIDLNGDGLLDIFVSRGSPVNAGKVRPGIETPGNTLLISSGAWDQFVEIPGALGAGNEVAYNRQPAFADVDGNGWLDLAIGCDNIGDTMGGFPHSRLYLFEPGESGLLSGRFEDIGGTDRVPDFGGWHDDDDLDKAGPDIQFADLDNDGDLDLLQACHVDIRDPLSEFSPAEYRQGVWCWKNLLKETGEVRFEKIKDNGLAIEGRLRWDEDSQQLVPETPAPGLPYVALADVNNDGLLDVLAIGPSDPGWAPRAEDVGGRFWRNLGDFQFEEATSLAGLESLNWTHRQWYEFHGMEVPEHLANWKPRYGPNYPAQPGKKKLSPMDERPYWADIVFGDFDNDGWQDFVAMDRRDGTTGREGRSVFYHNQGDGTFHPLSQGQSGIDAKGISGEAVDLNNDGWLDLVFGADPDNSGGWRRTDAPERYQDKVFLNIGEMGAGNHWLRLRFTGVSHHALAGAQVVVNSGDRTQMRTIFSAHAYKSGGPMEAHFGLGKAQTVRIEVTLLDGRSYSFTDVKADQILDLTLGDAAQPEADLVSQDSSVGEALGLPRFLRQLDQNRDGVLSKAEFRRPEMFEAMDGNRDGKVSGTEAFTYWTNRQALNAPRMVDDTEVTTEEDGRFEQFTEVTENPVTAFPWPQFLGPNSNGLALEGPPLAKAWPEKGPSILWRTEVSGGFGGVAVDQGRVFLLDRPTTNEEALRCFDFATGTELWRYTYPTRNVRLPYSGSRTVPSVEGDLVWTLGVVGELRCLDWAKGELLWHVDLLEQAELNIPPRWGVSQSPLRHRGLVIAPAINDETGSLLAFDERTGELRWQTADLGGANYVTPTLHQIDGAEQILMFGKDGASGGAWHGINPETGAVLWTWTGYNNPAQITHPVALGDDQFWITGGYDVGSRIIQIKQTSGTWTIDDLGGHESAGSQVHTPLLYEGHLFANLNTNENLRRSRRPEAGIGCFDLSGNLLWNTGEAPHFDRGALLIADGLLFAMEGETGELALIDPSPETYRELGRVTLFEDRAKQSWAPLAITDCRLFVRSQSEWVSVEVGQSALEP